MLPVNPLYLLLVNSWICRLPVPFPVRNNVVVYISEEGRDYIELPLMRTKLESCCFLIAMLF